MQNHIIEITATSDTMMRSDTARRLHPAQDSFPVAKITASELQATSTTRSTPIGMTFMPG
uniref:Coatomer subunit beta n=1 Tax=Oryza punctata TaxID=4537 RepID=A0A0E0MD01_ORYPU